MGDRTVRAISRTDVAKDHERRGPVLPALADVGAVGFLAYRVKVQLPHQLLKPQIVGAAGRLDLEPIRLSLRERLRAMAPEDLIESFWHSLSRTREKWASLPIYIRSGRDGIAPDRTEVVMP